jgi:hypothetical protein
MCRQITVLVKIGKNYGVFTRRIGCVPARRSENSKPDMLQHKTCPSAILKGQMSNPGELQNCYGMCTFPNLLYNLRHIALDVYIYTIVAFY